MAYYTIKSRFNGLCLDVEGNQTQDGARVQLWSPAKSSNQLWRFIKKNTGNYHDDYLILSKQSGKALIFDGELQISEANQVKDQYWAIRAEDTMGFLAQAPLLLTIGWFGWRAAEAFVIRSMANNKCLDVAEFGKNNGARVHLWDFVVGENQFWDLQLEEKIHPKIYFLYDTSFLCSENAWKLLSKLFSDISETLGKDDFFQVTHIVPKSVQQELKRHLENEEKEGVGKIGRANVAKLIGLGNYIESDPPDKSRAKLEGILRPDSPTDCEILNKAVELVESDLDSVVFTFTNDGGILTQISYLYSNQNLNVFSDATLSQFKAFIGKQRELAGGHGYYY